MAERTIVRIEPVTDFAALGARWQALERVCDGGFFLSWVFLGCQAEQRFAGASLLSVSEDGQDAALALLGVRGRSAFLNETGIAAHDAVFIEHNGLLVRPGHKAVQAAAIAAILRQFSSLTLSGVGAVTLAHARRAGILRLHAVRMAPAVDLAALQRPYLDTLSANARAQIRRAMRVYEQPPTLARAQTCTEALDWFADLVRLHEETWTGRGRPGAFADPAIEAWHRDLVASGFAAGSVDLLRVAAGTVVVGYLYCFIGGSRVLSYQSGFAYSADARAKPGLVCHALAIGHYRAAGMAAYDLLGGADRYKRTLAQGGEELTWGTLYRRWSAQGLAAAGYALVRRLADRRARIVAG